MEHAIPRTQHLAIGAHTPNRFPNMLPRAKNAARATDTCKKTVQIRYGWTITLAMRCDQVDQVYMVAGFIYSAGSSEGGADNSFYQKVEPADDPEVVMQYSVQPWNPAGRYHLWNAARGKEVGVNTLEDVALCTIVNGDVYCLTQSTRGVGWGGCMATLEPAASGDKGLLQHWRFFRASDGGRSTRLCYSWEYQLVGGRDYKEQLVAICSFMCEPSAQPDSCPLGDTRDDLCHDVFACRAANRRIVLSTVNTDDKGKCKSGYSGNMFFVTPVPMQVLVTCQGSSETWDMKEALRRYREIQNEGCNGDPSKDCVFAVYPC